MRCQFCYGPCQEARFFLTDEHIQRGVTKKEPDDSREQYTQQKGYEVKDL